MTTEAKIEVTSGGPIEGTFAIDLSKGPGAYEFRGARGTGKTTCISSIDWLAGHKVDVTLHDGAVSGKVEGFGVVAPIGGRKRRKGSFELDTIDAEKFSLTDLIDPQGKTPEVRDAQAIKALAVLSEVKADPKLYYDLAGGQKAFDALGVDVPNDPVLLATRVKRALDAIGNTLANTAIAEAGHAIPLEHVPDELDITKESDLVELGAQRDKARDKFNNLKSQRQLGIEKEADIDAANARLTKIQSEYSGPTVGDADAARKAVEGRGVEASARVSKLERELEQARNEVESCKTEYRAANSTFEAAKSHAIAVEELHSLASQTAMYPGEPAISKAEVDVECATTAYDQGVRIRDVKKNQERAKTHREAEKKATKESIAAKEKAGQVFGILARSLNTKHLEIQSIDGNPRLFVNHPKRGKTAFDRVNGLSDGERVDFTLRELLPHIEAPGLLPIPQRVWQDLQPSDRFELHKLAVEKGLYLFGAQVDEGDLRVVYLGENE